jgi:hypothetical protein
MTREDAAKLWPIIKAYSEGGRVQFQGLDGAWSDTPDPQFVVPRYRIKPEPVECWGLADRDGRVIETHTAERIAAKYASEGAGWRVVHLREVEE